MFVDERDANSRLEFDPPSVNDEMHTLLKQLSGDTLEWYAEEIQPQWVSALSYKY